MMVLVPGLRDPPVLWVRNDECSERNLSCNGGTCMNTPGTFTCDCSCTGTGFEGPTCAILK